MCGFVYISRKDGRPAYKSVLKRYRAQKARGTQGFGYVAIQNDQIISYKRAETEHEIVNLLSKEKAPEILFHHRQPTGTPNMTEQAHPFLVENEMLDHQYFVAHNGVIRNTAELYDAHEKMGIGYSSEMLKAYVSKNGEQHVTGVVWNDSESLAVETALALDGKKNRIETEGPAAVIGLQTKGKKVINRFFFRNMLNPLKWHEDKVMITITSMGEGTVVEPSQVYRINPTGGFSVLSEKLLPFLSYKPTVETYHSTHGSWVNGAWVSKKKEDTTTMGYLRQNPMMKAIGDVLGLPPSPDDREEEVSYGAPDDELSWEKDALLSTVSLAELWAEHDISVAKEKQLKGKIAIIDSRTSYTAEVLANREALENEADSMDRWISAVMDEIVDRNSKDDETAHERLFK